jgi:hypothetical protein
MGGLLMGPGLTEDNTDNSWYELIDTHQWYYNMFSFRCVIFKNEADATIANLLSEQYVD